MGVAILGVRVLVDEVWKLGYGKREPTPDNGASEGADVGVRTGGRAGILVRADAGGRAGTDVEIAWDIVGLFIGRSSSCSSPARFRLAVDMSLPKRGWAACDEPFKGKLKVG